MVGASMGRGGVPDCQCRSFVGDLGVGIRVRVHKGTNLRGP